MARIRHRPSRLSLSPTACVRLHSHSTRSAPAPLRAEFEPSGRESAHAQRGRLSCRLTVRITSRRSAAVTQPKFTRTRTRTRARMAWRRAGRSQREGRTSRMYLPFPRRSRGEPPVNRREGGRRAAGKRHAAGGTADEPAGGWRAGAVRCASLCCTSVIYKSAGDGEEKRSLACRQTLNGRPTRSAGRGRRRRRRRREDGEWRSDGGGGVGGGATEEEAGLQMRTVKWRHLGASQVTYARNVAMCAMCP